MAKYAEMEANVNVSLMEKKETKTEKKEEKKDGKR